MDAFLSRLPRNILALGAIGLGFLLIILNDPPRTVCDAQIANFQTSQESFLYSTKIPSGKKPPEIIQLVERCQIGNSAGACLELFSKTKKMIYDLKGVSSECSAVVGKTAEVKKWTWRVAQLFVELAWGEKPPAAYTQRTGWLDNADVALYCALKDTMIRLYGSEQWDAFRETMFQKLPQASGLGRDQVWQRSVFSVRCEYFR